MRNDKNTMNTITESAVRRRAKKLGKIATIKRSIAVPDRKRLQSMRYIKNVADLRRALANGQREFKLHLRSNLISSKYITPCADGRFQVVNCCDDSVKTLTGRELYTRSNVGKAMRLKAFYDAISAYMSGAGEGLPPAEWDIKPEDMEETWDMVRIEEGEDGKLAVLP
jgi:hypothetical protein